jgi:hypothetical protein
MAGAPIERNGPGRPDLHNNQGGQQKSAASAGGFKKIGPTANLPLSRKTTWYPHSLIIMIGGFGRIGKAQRLLPGRKPGSKPEENELRLERGC